MFLSEEITQIDAYEDDNISYGCIEVLNLFCVF